jgi:hypothetical protein
MTGFIRGSPPRTCKSRISSTQTRDIHAAAPVYQDQPPCPIRPGNHAQHSHRPLALPFVRAMTIQMAACVYCPPFSRTPGGYP